MEDITKLSDEQLSKLICETEARVKLRIEKCALQQYLWDLVHAVGRLLDDKYSDGDELTRQNLWSDMHKTADLAREYLQNIENQ
jgi:hypothetical protein